jgi:hypothetical protein
VVLPSGYAKPGRRGGVPGVVLNRYAVGRGGCETVGRGATESVALPLAWVINEQRQLVAEAGPVDPLAGCGVSGLAGDLLGGAGAGNPPDHHDGGLPWPK